MSSWRGNQLKEFLSWSGATCNWPFIAFSRPLFYTQCGQWTQLVNTKKVNILRENQMPSANLALFYIIPQGSSSANTWKLEYVCTLWTLWLVNFLAKSLLWKSAFVHGVVHFKGFSKDGRMHNASKVQVWVDDTCRNFMHVHGPWRSLEGELGSSFSFVSSSPGATISFWFQGLSNNRF